MILAGVCGGCVGSLAGSSWTAVEINGKSDEDQAAVKDVESIFVEFLSDGRLRTSVKHKDGSVDREDDETYKVDGDAVVIRHPNYERRVQYTLAGDTMHISSDRFEMKLERFRRTAADQPAMFRPASVGRVEYRSLSNMPRSGGARR